MLEFAKERMLWWNVIVEMVDGTLRSTYSRGHDFNNALVWFDNAKYIKASSERKRIVEIYNKPSETYDDFLKKEKLLKEKYKIK